MTASELQALRQGAGTIETNAGLLRLAAARAIERPTSLRHWAELHDYARRVVEMADAGFAAVLATADPASCLVEPSDTSS